MKKVLPLLLIFLLAGCTSQLVYEAKDKPRFFGAPPNIFILADNTYRVCNSSSWWINEQDVGKGWSGIKHSAFDINLEGKFDKRGNSYFLMNKSHLRKDVSCDQDEQEISLPICDKSKKNIDCVFYVQADDGFSTKGIYVLNSEGMVYLELEKIKGNPYLAFLTPFGVATDIAFSPLYAAYFTVLAIPGN